MFCEIVWFQENRRLEVDLLDCTEKLAEAQSQISKLQTNLENVMKDKVLKLFWFSKVDLL